MDKLKIKDERIDETWKQSASLFWVTREGSSSIMDSVQEKTKKNFEVNQAYTFKQKSVSQKRHLPVIK